MLHDKDMKMTNKVRVLGLLLLAAAPLVIGCNSNSPTRAASGTGGYATGGSATGGSSSGTGGAVETGGSLATGGTSAAGGSLATGGTLSAGGGGSGTGGIVATGGTSQSQGTGGKITPTGGTPGSGGASAVGGTASSGGTPGTGGTIATDGSPTGAGGMAGTGGSSSTGGNRDAGLDTRTDVGVGDGPGPDTVSVGDVEPSKKITVWMSGDSTMAGDTCAGGGWGDQFGALFNSNVTIDNRSVAGRSIQTWLYEGNVSSTMGSNGECTLTATTYSANWNAMLNASTGMKAGDYLFIEFGINDGDSTCPRHVGTTLFQTYLTTMAKAASDRGAQTIFLTSTSAIACSGATAQANRGFGPQTKAAGTAANVPVIDMTVLTANLYTSLGLCPNNADYTSTTSKVGLFFCNDHTHFEAAGATQIASVAAKALRDQGIGLAAYLK